MSTMEEKSRMLSELLKVLSNENRLLILCALIENPLNVSELMKFVPSISQSSLSQHLSVLKAHDIVDYEKKGQTVTYFIKDKRIESVMNALKANYCAI